MRKRIPILIGFIILFLAVWAQITAIPFIRYLVIELEHLGYDFQLRAKIFTQQNTDFETSVAIIDIDDKSLSKEGRWPWSRLKMAELISHLQEYGATVIALDMLFSEKEDNIIDIVSMKAKDSPIVHQQIHQLLGQLKPLFDNDTQFANALSKTDTVIGMSFVPRPFTVGQLPSPLLTLSTPREKALDIVRTIGYISPISTLQTAAKNGGFLNVFPDEDGIIRRVPMLLNYHDKIYPSLALEAVRLYLLTNATLITAPYGDQEHLEGIQLGNHLIPTDSKAQTIIPFRGRSFTFPYFSATDVLHKKIPADALQGKIVFVGTSATGLGDLVPTAVQNPFPGIEIQATIADAILSDKFLYAPAWALGAEISITILIGILIALGFPYLGPRILSLVIVALPISLLLLNGWFAEKTGLLISILIPETLIILLGVINIIYGYLFESRRREHLKQMFGQYVPATHIDEMLHSTGNYGLYGEEREMTVLFADIRHFTSISENLSASQLKELLNDFFTPMTEIIFKYHGTIDKYIGDMIMAFWGAPLKDKKHAQHALTAALEMQRMVKKIQEQLSERGWPMIRIGIGLNSGMMSVGDMGSKFRRNYTVLGDAVNLASRSESLTKFYGVSIIATENTHRDQKNFVFQQLDRVRVKGKRSAIAIYQVIGREGHVTSKKHEELQRSQEALMHYFNQAWGPAEMIYHQLHVDHPNTKLYSIYLKRIEAFKKNPPPEDWDGVFIHHSK